MADPITIQWGALATEIVKNAIVGGGAAALTALLIRRSNKATTAPPPAPLPVQVMHGRCSSHPYIEIGLLNIRRRQDYQKTLLIQLCTHFNCQIPPEPPEMAVEQQDRRT